MLLHDTAHHAIEWLDDWHIEASLAAAFGMVVLAIVAWAADPAALIGTVIALIAFSPLWLPVFLFVIFWKIWMHYIRYAFWFSKKMILVHIELPPEVSKSPLAIELILISLHSTGGEGTFIARIINGSFRAITTLELVSNEGRIGYYVHLRKEWKDTFEARVYGQFPEARITEVLDYVDQVPFTKGEYDVWGCEYAKAAEEALPIRTYIDFGLDKNTDTPEVQVDPITNILEFLGSMRQHEYLWLQIVMKARKKDEWYGFYKGDHYKTDAQAAINRITQGGIKRAMSLNPDEMDKKKVGATPAILNEVEKKKIEAIENSLTKQVFDCGIRGLYMAKSGHFNSSRIGNLVNIWAPFSMEGRNKLFPTRGNTIFDYPWQDPFKIREKHASNMQFFWYKHRAYFYVPYDQKEVCMTTEEIATLWHFPNSQVKTPSLQRVPTRRAEAPANLPL